jgi:hypothetical protein
LKTTLKPLSFKTYSSKHNKTTAAIPLEAWIHAPHHATDMGATKVLDGRAIRQYTSSSEIAVLTSGKEPMTEGLYCADDS